MSLLWEMVRALLGALVRGLLAGFVAWAAGEMVVNMQIMPSGAPALGLVGWMLAANVLLAASLRQIFDRMPVAGMPRNEQRSAFFFQMFAAGAAALVLGLFFEAIVFGLMTYFGVINPYFCILAFGLSFGSFWLTFLALSHQPETADAGH